MSNKFANSQHMLGLNENIDVAQIKPTGLSIRNDVGEIDQLALSMTEKGLLQPIIVRISGDGYEIVAGNRRFFACKRIGWRKIPCHIVDLSDKESFEVSVIENLQRKTMNPIEEANAFRLYVEEHGWGGVSELARKIGKSQEYVTKRIKLLELPEEIQQGIIRHRIKTSIAEELAYVKDKEELSKLAQLIAKRHVTVKKFRQLYRPVDNASMEDYDTHFVSMLESKNMVVSFDKAAIALKLTLKRLDEIIEDEDNFLIRDFLMHQRAVVHSQIDLIIKSSKKFTKFSRHYP